MANVEIYTKGYCPYCHRAKALLTEKDVAYVEYPIDNDHDLREVMIARANGRTTVPQIFINDVHIGGCADMVALNQQGKLDPLLAQ